MLAGGNLGLIALIGDPVLAGAITDFIGMDAAGKLPLGGIAGSVLALAGGYDDGSLYSLG